MISHWLITLGLIFMASGLIILLVHTYFRTIRLEKMIIEIKESIDQERKRN